MSRIVFLPWDLTAPAAAGETILDLARRAGVRMNADCGGRGRCGSCLVRVEGCSCGEVSAPTEEELALLPAKGAGGYRLACKTRVLGERDVTVFVPPESLIAESSPRKPFTRQRVKIDPCVSKVAVDLPDPLCAPDATLVDRVRQVLAQERPAVGGVGLDVLADFSLQPGAQHCSRVTAAVFGKELIQLRPGDRPGLLGLALDLGTTSLVAFLCDLEADRIVGVESAVNPQVAYGEDVISRIARVQAAPSNFNALRETLLREVNRLVTQLIQQAGVAPDDVLDVVAVGNPTMQHFFLGLNPESLGRAPYLPLCREGGEVRAGSLGLAVYPEAKVHLLPMISGFVGADTLAALLPVGRAFFRGTKLLVDVGTNGEIVLARDGELFATSCATGPVFEGAHIRCGMRAAPGAIEGVSVDGDGRIRCRVVQAEGKRPRKPAGLCGSGVISAVAALLGAGRIAPDGAFDLEKAHPGIRVDPSSGVAEAVLVPAPESHTKRDVVLNQWDVRGVQLGKAALRAGIDILMREHGVDRLDRIYLAGTFGNYLAPADVLAIGMFPPMDPEKITPIGNAAGDGARLALFSRAMRRRARRLAEKIRVVELTRRPDFQETFVDSMPFGPCEPT
ncbi:MAG: DUF4445 domain-containing protein [Deltaproteobacteria bacterium]|nr:DUF4445 domain-containing protein [Deltaproteobacteria bacterium]